MEMERIAKHGERAEEPAAPAPNRRWRKYARDIAPALLVSAAVLLVVEHWKHFDRSDTALSALILASAAVQVFVREGKSYAPGVRNKSGPRDRTEIIGEHS